jgi:hypothetical protein
MLNMKTFVLAVLCFLMVGLSYAQSQEPSPGRGAKGKPIQQNATASEKPTSQDQRGTEQMPLVIKSIPPEKTPDQAKEDRNERDTKSTTERWLTIYTGLLALFTFCLIVVGSVQIFLFVWQLRLIRDSLTDTKHAADAANKSADAAERTVNTMKDTAERQLRAYVSIHMVEIIDVAAGFTPRANLVFKNFGQTPAYDLIGIGGMAMEVSWETLAPPSSDPIEITTTTLHSGATICQSIVGRRKLIAGEREALIDGTKTLWVYGETRYKDTFNVERITEFRFQIGGTSGINILNEKQMAVSQQGNRET